MKESTLSNPDASARGRQSSRRDFLKMSGTLAGGALLLPGLLRVSGPGRLKNTGIQLYTVRAEMTADAKGTLQKLAHMGINEIESARSDKGNYYGLQPKEIRQICADLGMTLRSGHVHVDKDWERSLDQAAETGQQYIISAILPSPGQTRSNYQAAADRFNSLGEQCKKAGLRFGYHNHDSEFELESGKILYDVLLERTDPALVTMELDLGWVVAAGQDPLKYFRDHPGRFALWHLKDMDMTRRVSTEFGRGSVPIPEILRQAGQSGMTHFFLEQEEYAHSAFESIQLDLDYLRQLHD